MSRYRTEREKQAAQARAQRNQGYADGVAGRPARRTNADYQQGWRNGQLRRQEIQRPLTEEGS
jgi:hypothetical protein